MKAVLRGAALAALLCLAILPTALKAGVGGVPNGDEAPNFTLTNLAGEEMTLESLRGKVVVLDFWATWCGPCRRALPHTQELANSEAARDGNLVVLTINQREKKDVVQKFMADNHYTFPVLMDARGEVGGSYKVRGIPTFYVVGKDGKVTFSTVGANHDALDEAVENALEAE